MKKLQTLLPASLLGLLVAVGAFTLIDCGGNTAVCGNGIVETGEDCDRGMMNGQAGVACSKECKSISVNRVQLNVTWTISLLGGGDPVPGYTSPGCTNFNATKAHVQIDGPTPYDKILDCSRYGIKYAGVCPEATDAGTPNCTPLSPGIYQATVTLLRDDLSAITAAVSTTKMQVNPGPEVNFLIPFEQNNFLNQSYTGSLDFHVSWGAKGKGCADPQPPVTQESIVLIPDKLTQPVVGMTVLGTKLDGTPGSCFTSDMITKTYEEVQNLPWGRYTLAVYSQNPPFCVKQAVFVNPGKFNTTYEMVAQPYVPPAPLPDGGTDDGGTPDGGANTCP